MVNNGSEAKRDKVFREQREQYKQSLRTTLREVERSEGFFVVLVGNCPPGDAKLFFSGHEHFVEVSE